jgi:hypothetical protein
MSVGRDIRGFFFGVCVEYDEWRERLKANSGEKSRRSAASIQSSRIVFVSPKKPKPKSAGSGGERGTEKVRQGYKYDMQVGKSQGVDGRGWAGGERRYDLVQITSYKGSYERSP